MATLLAEARGSPHAERLALLEELAVARASALRALALATPALEGSVTDPGVVARSLEVLREAMKFVRDLVVAAARVEQAGDAVPARVVATVLAQVSSAVAAALADDAEAARRVMDEIGRRTRCQDSTPST